MTPPMASVPYREDAPSRSTSTRSIAPNGIMFRSGAELSNALLAMRRPLSRTSVLFAPMPRMSAKEAPPVLAPTTCEVPTDICTALTLCRICSTVVTPCFFRSSILTIVTGCEVSASTRLIDEPVISTRCTSSCANAADALMNRPALAAVISAEHKAVRGVDGEILRDFFDISMEGRKRRPTAGPAEMRSLLGGSMASGDRSGDDTSPHVVQAPQASTPARMTMRPSIHRCCSQRAAANPIREV